jgi:hypothetical protein
VRDAPLQGLIDDKAKPFDSNKDFYDIFAMDDQSIKIKDTDYFVDDQNNINDNKL